MPHRLSANILQNELSQSLAPKSNDDRLQTQHSETNSCWLVSVKDRAELEQAAQFCVDIIDLKQPEHGPLAPVSVSAWRQAAEFAMSTPICLSAALGEKGDALEMASEVPNEFSFAKVGPSDCDLNELKNVWNTIRGHLPESVRLVAVAYADATQATSPPTHEILRLAHDLGLRHFLIDTYQKDGRTSVDHLGINTLRELDQQAKKLGMWWALAGSVSLASAQMIRDAGIQPDCFGVRGDVCDGDRAGHLSESRLREWSARIKQLGAEA